MLGMKTHFDISGSIEIREVDIAGVACIYKFSNPNRIITVIATDMRLCHCFSSHSAKFV